MDDWLKVVSANLTARVNTIAILARRGTDHGRHKVERAHADADVFVVDASENHVLVLRYKFWVRGHNLDQCQQRDVLH